MLLFLMTFLMNILSTWLRDRFRESARAGRIAWATDCCVRRRLRRPRLAALAALLVDVARDGLSRLSWAFLTSYP
ncbi:MAG: hypothetical protein U0Q12_03425 [Vicinamibacterales bacterium]